jgi:DnaK suppressor protein
MDELDRAQAASEVYEEAAIRSHFNKKKLEPAPDASAGGKRRCIECEKIIPLARIAANPNAVRCIDCQTKYEREGET